MEKLKVALYAFEAGHQICWKTAKVLQTKPNHTKQRVQEMQGNCLYDLFGLSN
jgi:hypothetical protein